jgi:ATP-binding protein involved in chromosome partitioning
MEITKEEVLKALSHVDDPDLNKDIVSLGMVRDVNIEGKKVSFRVVPSSIMYIRTLLWTLPWMRK